MKRREFIGLLGGGAAWPVAAWGQQRKQMPRVGVLLAGMKGETSSDQALAAFAKALQELGWTDGQNVQIDYRWAGTDAQQMKTLARELASLKPDVILAQTTQVVAALTRETSTTLAEFGD